MLVAAAHFTAAKVQQMCELARELNFRHGFARESLPDWVSLEFGAALDELLQSAGDWTSEFRRLN